LHKPTPKLFTNFNLLFVLQLGQIISFKLFIGYNYNREYKK